MLSPDILSLILDFKASKVKIIKLLYILNSITFFSTTIILLNFISGNINILIIYL